ncbi:MAG: DUF3592 domain-containing protein [Pseudomonadota bacterium]
MRVFNIPYQAFITGLATVLILGAMVWIEIINLPILAALEREGVPGTARVTEMVDVWDSVRATRGGRSKRVYFVFTTAAGEEVESSRRVGRHVWQRLEIGSPVQVVYLPDRPHIHSASIQHGYAGRWMIWLLVPFFPVTAGLSWWFWRRSPYAGPPRLWPPIRFG